MPHKTQDDRLADRATFESTFRRTYDRLSATLTPMAGSPERAEDLASEALRVAWEKRAQFRGRSTLDTWVQAIGRNAARHSWRRERRAEVLSPWMAKDDVVADHGSTMLERQNLRATVQSAAARLPSGFRRLLIDRYVEGLSTEAIARREGIPLGTVGSRLFKARALFRAAWKAASTGRERPADMADDKAQRIVEDATRRLVAELEAGRSETLRHYLAAMGRFHRYSWTNTLLIQTQRPAATRVAGYHTWRDLGRAVKRGEKGIVIYAPIARRTTIQEPERPREQRENAPSQPVGFRAVYVFDVEQTEGTPLPEFARTSGDPGVHLERLKSAVAARGIALDYFNDSEMQSRADGFSTGGQIKLRPGMDPAEEFSVLAHELAHELLHHGKDRTDFSKTVRETQAEAVAFVVSRGIGLDTNSAARDYIALYDGNAKTLTESLAAVQRASSEILRDLLPDREFEREPLAPSGSQTREQMVEQSERETPTAVVPLEQSDSMSPDR